MILDGHGPAWLVTGYAAAKQVLGDPRFASWFPGMPTDRLLDEDAAGLLFVMNGPRHLAIRRAVGAAMGGDTLRQLRARTEALAARRVSILHQRDASVDLLHELAVPLSAATLGELLGAPTELCRRLEGLAGEAASMFAPPATPEAGGAETRLLQWVEDLIGVDRTHPPAGLVTELLQDHDDKVGLRPAVVPNVVLTLLLGGLVPPARALVHGLLRLMQRPGYLDRLREDPALVAPTVEELLRLDHAVTSDSFRLATADIELGGVGVRQGGVVIIAPAAINRDPGAFERPDEIDPTRAGTGHLSFAAGAHRCLGAAIARLQLHAGLDAIIASGQTPTLAVGLDQLDWRPGYFTGLPSLQSQPVRLDSP
ncbi:MAG: cytochrome P450 [Actinomycetota bacterium]|nr:cytochrome P450 [Actinomycetota bacterium]